ncbi:MAG: hypothetical protein N2376_07155 [Clostridia bacterium]|nr:hypothetical protein [Clostridia bacterium]
MNIGLILPAKPRNRKRNYFIKLSEAIGALFFTSAVIDCSRIELQDGVNLFVLGIPCEEDRIGLEGIRRRIKNRLDKLFEENSVWPIIEHPDVKGTYNPQPIDPEASIREAALKRFPELLKLLHGVGNLSAKEILITGESSYLEMAISKLFMNVKYLNILLPEGHREPDEAEMAFLETGIPIHMTTDPDVLKRVVVWLRFPGDDEGFDLLPETYKGIIIDLGALKIIDTKNKKIFNIVLEFSDRFKRKIGHSILEMWNKGDLENMVAMVCANAWDISVTEASLRLGMRLSFKS